LLAPGERFHLAGHSFGGAVALRLAHARRNYVLSLSVFEPTAFHLIPRDARALEEVVQIAHVVKQGLADGQWLAAARSFIDFWSGRGAFDHFSPGRQAQFAAQLRKADLDFDALLGDPHSARDYAAIACPMLVMLGRRHRECTRAVASELARHHSSCLVRFVEGGHMAPISHGDIVNAEIDAFTAMVDEQALRATA
jgi:pimeloyl-ACP methyl ester carboxylesterase